MLGLLVLASPLLAGQSGDYVVGAQDVLTVTFWDQSDLSGKYSVGADGTFAFPMVGRIKAGGMKVREVEAELKKRLADGYFKDPQLSVSIEEYRSQRIFIVGEVRNPGTYPLTGDMTLIEALAHAGSITADASREAVIVRPRAGQAAGGPTLPEQSGAADVVRVDLRKLENGSLADNIALRDGDTIFVTRAETIFVFGEVKNPGTFPVQRGTTVLQALSLAGGLTERGSTSRLKVVRFVNGQKKEIKLKLTDLVEAGDTIVVSERIF
jgi:polysaccharide biosynthesis/export protein